MGGDLSEPVLEQREVDAILQGMSSGAVSTAAPADAAPTDVRPFALGREPRMLRERMPTLEIINERFARQQRESLYKLVRRVPTVAVQAPQCVAYGELLQRFEAPVSINLVRLPPLRGIGVVVLDAALVSSLVDQYFGGRGRPARIESRAFTPSEMRVVRLVLDAVFADLQRAWSSVVPLQPELRSSESNPQFANALEPDASLLLLSFRIDLESTGGELHVAIPQLALDPWREALSATVQGAREHLDGRFEQAFREDLEDAEVAVTTRLGSATLSLAQLVNLGPGDVVDCDFDGRATVYAEEVPILRGSFGVSRGRQAVKVLERAMRHRGSDAGAAG